MHASQEHTASDHDAQSDPPREETPSGTTVNKEQEEIKRPGKKGRLRPQDAGEERGQVK